VTAERIFIDRAIRKAIKNGWKKPDMPYEIDLSGEIYESPKIRLYDEWVDLEHVLFDPEFGKALWGEQEAPSSTDKSFTVNHPHGWVEHVFNAEVHYPLGTGWQYHFQRMVVAENRIIYLGHHT